MPSNERIKLVDKEQKGYIEVAPASELDKHIEDKKIHFEAGQKETVIQNINGLLNKNEETWQHLVQHDASIAELQNKANLLSKGHLLGFLSYNDINVGTLEENFHNPDDYSFVLGVSSIKQLAQLDTCLVKIAIYLGSGWHIFILPFDEIATFMDKNSGFITQLVFMLFKTTYSDMYEQHQDKPLNPNLAYLTPIERDGDIVYLLVQSSNIETDHWNIAITSQDNNKKPKVFIKYISKEFFDSNSPYYFKDSFNDITLEDILDKMQHNFVKCEIVCNNLDHNDLIIDHIYFETETISIKPNPNNSERKLVLCKPSSMEISTVNREGKKSNYDIACSFEDFMSVAEFKYKHKKYCSPTLSKTGHNYNSYVSAEWLFTGNFIVVCLSFNLKQVNFLQDNFELSYIEIPDLNLLKQFKIENYSSPIFSTRAFFYIMEGPNNKSLHLKVSTYHASQEELSHIKNMLGNIPFFKDNLLFIVS